MMVAWHRTAQAVLQGEASRRRTMYMAWIDEPYDPRDESSKTPLFKRLQKFCWLNTFNLRI